MCELVTVYKSVGGRVSELSIDKAEFKKIFKPVPAVCVRRAKRVSGN